jgi:G3E family GTPase
MTTRVNAICGFLGSGKTTLVRHILAERAGRERMAVIVNEFGAMGVDGAVLQGHSVDMIELSAGCICCTLKGSLVSAVEELRDRAGVERIVIESTGVAQPGDLVETLSEPGLRDSVVLGPLVTVVDAAKFPHLRKVLGEFYTAQIRRADIVLLNKTDLAGPAQLAAVRAEIEALNARARILTTERCQVELDMVLDRTSGGREPSALEQGLASPAPAASFVSFVVKADFDADGTKLAGVFAALPPAIVRAKGFMRVDGQLHLVQYAAGQLEVSPAAAGARAPSMVFIAASEPDRQAVQQALEGTARA